MFLVLPFSYTNTLWCSSANKKEIKHTKTLCLGSSAIDFGGQLDFLGHHRTQRFLLGLSAAPSPCAANSWTAKSCFLSSSGGDNMWDDGSVHKLGLRLATASCLVVIHGLWKSSAALWEQSCSLWLLLWHAGWGGHIRPRAGVSNWFHLNSLGLPCYGG